MARDEVDEILGDEEADEGAAPPAAPAKPAALPDGLLVAAEEIMDVLGGSWGSESPSDSDSKVQKATKAAARRAKAEILAQALLDFFQIADGQPHAEGPHEDEEEALPDEVDAIMGEEDDEPPFG
jgi:hypothetical protein